MDARLRTADRHSLPPHLKAEILRELRRLELVLEMIRPLRPSVMPLLRPSLSRGIPAPKRSSIWSSSRASGQSLPQCSSAKCSTELLTTANKSEALTPSPFQSGFTSRDQGISRAGNAKARTAMIELAWLWLRNQPDSSLSVWFRERVG